MSPRRNGSRLDLKDRLLPDMHNGDRWVRNVPPDSVLYFKKKDNNRTMQPTLPVAASSRILLPTQGFYTKIEVSSFSKDGS